MKNNDFSAFLLLKDMLYKVSEAGLLSDADRKDRDRLTLQLSKIWVDSEIIKKGDETK